MWHVVMEAFRDVDSNLLVVQMGKPRPRRSNELLKVPSNEWNSWHPSYLSAFRWEPPSPMSSLLLTTESKTLKIQKQNIETRRGAVFNLAALSEPMSRPLTIPGKPSWHPALCGWGSCLCQSLTSPPPNAEGCLLLGKASSPVIFLWWYLVLPTKLRLWQRTETTSSSLVQLRFHINKLKCILTVCKVNLPAFRRRLWHLLFRHLTATS